MRLIVALLCLVLSGLSHAAQVSFTDGVVAEYRNNAHGADNPKSFAYLGVSEVVLSDGLGSSYFGSQGNDENVVLTFRYPNGTSKTFNAAINWRVTTTGGALEGIGLTVASVVDDGTSYSLTTGYDQTYLIDLVGGDLDLSSSSGSAYVANDIKGNAASSPSFITDTFSLLNAYIDDVSDGTIVGTTPSLYTSTITASPTSITANGSTTSTITVQLKDVNGNNLSASGGTVALSTTAGSLGAVTDNTDGTYTATLTSSTSEETATITGTLTPSGGSAGTIDDNATVDFTVGSITGTYARRNGTAVSGATVTLLNSSGGTLATTTTNSSGVYSFTGLSAGTYQVRFSPTGSTKVKAKTNRGTTSGALVSNITVSTTEVSNVDAIAIDPAGVVYDSVTRSAITGAVVKLYYDNSGTATLVPNSWLDTTNGDSNSHTTDSSGEYSFILNGSAATSTYTLEVTEPAGYTFESVAIPSEGTTYTPSLGGSLEPIQSQSTAPSTSEDTTYYLSFAFTIGTNSDDTSNGVINNHIPLDPTPDVSIAATTNGTEGSTDGLFTVTLSTESASATTVSYSVAGTATSGSDYAALSGSITIPAGSTTGTITVDVTDDALVEGSETVVVTLTSVTPTASIDTSNDDATVSITDNDSATVSIANTTDSSEPTSDGTLTVTLSAASSTDTTISYSVSGTATGGTDYASLSGSITIPAGSTSGTLTVDVSDDGSVEGNETVIVTLSAVTSGASAITIDGSNDEATNTIFDDDGAPVITGPTGGAGSATSAISVYENQTAVTQLSANKSVTWSITGGSDSVKFSIAADGTITFDTAPNYELPTDSDINNTYVLTVTATDGVSNTSTQTITVTVLDLDDTAPAITGPSGSAGSATSAISVNENQTAVTQLSANESVTWSITGGSDSAKFSIASDGTITFDAAPDYENPTDSDTNNTYVLIVTATDASGNTSTQTITVTVLDVSDSNPVITGPSGGAGAAASAISVYENQTAVTQMSADISVTWSLTGGTDYAKFSIASDGTITFDAAPDYESPTDSDTNNTYVLVVTATSSSGGTSTQTVTVTVLDLSEALTLLNQIKTDVKDSLKKFAHTGLRDAVRFNENVLTGMSNDCRPVTTALNPQISENKLAMGYQDRLNDCRDNYRANFHVDVSATRISGDWVKRLQAGLLLERNVDEETILGVGVTFGAAIDNKLSGFSVSSIDDKSVMLNLLGKHYLDSKTWLSGYFSLGKSWYDFDLTQDSLLVDGQLTSNRFIYGMSLARDGELFGRSSNVKLDISRAVEQFDDVELAATLTSSDRVSGVRWGLEDVDLTRISAPLTVNVLEMQEGVNNERSDIMLGLLCEDASVTSSSLSCGYQAGINLTGRNESGYRYRWDYQFEKVDSQKSHVLSLDLTKRLSEDMALSLRSGYSSTYQMDSEQSENDASWQLGLEHTLDVNELSSVKLHLAPVEGFGFDQGGKVSVIFTGAF